jgi:hypothetical protein
MKITLVEGVHIIVLLSVCPSVCLSSPSIKIYGLGRRSSFARQLRARLRARLQLSGGVTRRGQARRQTSSWVSPQQPSPEHLPGLTQPPPQTWLGRPLKVAPISQ